MNPRGVSGWRPERLAEARRRRALTQRELAWAVDVTPWTVYSWERDWAAGEKTRAPTARHLGRLAKVLDVPARWLAPLPPDASLRDLRQRAGLSQAAMAAHIGTSPATIGRVESADWWPSRAEEWAELLGVALVEFRTAWEHSRSP